jgi:hypothetical protein
MINSDELPEGKSNLYFTTKRAREALYVKDDLTYEISTGTFRYDATPLRSRLDKLEIEMVELRSILGLE